MVILGQGSCIHGRYCFEGVEDINKLCRSVCCNHRDHVMISCNAIEAFSIEVTIVSRCRYNQGHSMAEARQSVTWAISGYRCKKLMLRCG
jgi:hypothetical protein